MEGDNTRLYFFADPLQMKEGVRRIFFDAGSRFVYSTRSPVPYILDEDGRLFFDPDNGYMFVPGKDEIIRQGLDGYVVTYGEMTYRCLDAVERLKNNGFKVGLVNKPTLNVVDEETLEEIGNAPFVLVVEGQNYKTGLGCRFGTWLLQRGFRPVYDHVGSTKQGNCGREEQVLHQGLDTKSIENKILSMLVLAGRIKRE